MLDRARPAVVVVCTPPHSHLPIATDVVTAGADLLLEKPPVAGLADHDRLDALLRRTGRRCQVGFQSLGSPALAELLRAVEAGHLGEVASVACTGTWIRTDAYWARSPWAGRRTLDGRPVTDGALSNPFAHSIMNALAVAAAAGGARAAQPTTAEQELYRARNVEVDEVGCVRAILAGGIVVLVAVTLCAERHRAPLVVVRGGGGEAVLDYKGDALRLPGDPAARTLPGRVGLLENLLDHRADPAGTPLLAPLARTRPFTAVIEAIHASPAPWPIDPAFLAVSGTGGDRRVVVAGVDRAILDAAERLALFSELGIPWASRAAVHRRGGPPPAYLASRPPTMGATP
jgi:predicted dehydrogenase